MDKMPAERAIKGVSAALGEHSNAPIGQQSQCFLSVYCKFAIREFDRCHASQPVRSPKGRRQEWSKALGRASTGWVRARGYTVGSAVKPPKPASDRPFVYFLKAGWSDPRLKMGES